MEAIKRIISKKQFKLYNIPDNFGEEAEMIILPFNRHEADNKISPSNLLKVQGKSGMVQMLNEPEEDSWDAL